MCELGGYINWFNKKKKTFLPFPSSISLEMSTYFCLDSPPPFILGRGRDRFCKPPQKKIHLRASVVLFSVAYRDSPLGILRHFGKIQIVISSSARGLYSCNSSRQPFKKFLGPKNCSMIWCLKEEHLVPKGREECSLTIIRYDVKCLGLIFLLFNQNCICLAECIPLY